MIAADQLSPDDQRAVGTIVLAGEYLWRHAGRLLRLRVCLFGRRADVTHLGMICRIHWWRDQPYLVSIREAA